MGEDQSDNLEPDGAITLRTLDGIASGFTQAKWWMWWKTVRCGGLISSSCSTNPHVKAGNDERRKRKKMIFICCQTLFLIYSQQFTKNITIYVAKCFEFFFSFWTWQVSKVGGREGLGNSIFQLAFNFLRFDFFKWF